MPDLSPRFDFKDVEARWCRFWEDSNIFHAEPKPGRPPYSIVIPPPNVTGILHMGHALNNTLQDIIARYKRMNGHVTCWMPGTDHAGIATQNVVEKQLAREGKTRYDIGRDEMLRRLWDWKKQYGDTIISQLKKLGSSCDWPRMRFTMDEEYSEAVKYVFVTLYEKGLIYRGKYIINWCPRCQTALSDEEAEHREQQGALYHIRYPLKDRNGDGIVVATTRPETMLGDTAVAVNPQDPRYKSLIGETLILPILNREIRIIADEFVDPAFGTGAVKVTPAHAPNDFAMGTRHKLDVINIMHPDARLNEHAGEFAGMDRFEAREAIIETLKNLKLLEKVEPHLHAVGHCYRCHTVVEPYLSQQWFVKMKPLAGPALTAVQEGRIKFYPERWTKVYLNWMENIRDWCISRQIWWGHRIPVWYCEGDGQCHIKCREPIVSMETPTQCPHCGSTNLKQDEDVLDTWFSSWLWPFATFNWPRGEIQSRDTKYEIRNTEKFPPTLHASRGALHESKLINPDLDYFYPTNSLFTASEIIFFWVARMIMAGLEFMGEVPFRDVYIHGTVRDSKGRKMSKSLGNAIDPLEIIAEYGADALRFSLIINSGQDLFISKEKFETGRNFANKIWNASRLVLLNTKPENRKSLADDNFRLMVIRAIPDLPSRWIVSKFYSTLQNVNRAIENYRFSEAENLIFEFFWRNFCDWYLEIIKNNFTDENIQKVAFTVLEQSIRMMHPFMPFVTEELWAHLELSQSPLSLSPWPSVNANLIDARAEADMETLTTVVSAIRNMRVQWNIKPQEFVQCHFAATDQAGLDLLENNQATLQFLLRIKDFYLRNELPDMKDAAAGLVGNVKFLLPLEGLIDIATEKQRMVSEIEANQKLASGIRGRLSNEGFLKKAPSDVVEKEKERLASLEQNIKELDAVLKNLQG